jgi:hypothetical protein
MTRKLSAGAPARNGASCACAVREYYVHGVARQHLDDQTVRCTRLSPPSDKRRHRSQGFVGNWQASSRHAGAARIHWRSSRRSKLCEARPQNQLAQAQHKERPCPLHGEVLLEKPLLGKPLLANHRRVEGRPPKLPKAAKLPRRRVRGTSATARPSVASNRLLTRPRRRCRQFGALSARAVGISAKM